MFTLWKINTIKDVRLLLCQKHSMYGIKYINAHGGRKKIPNFKNLSNKDYQRPRNVTNSKIIQKVCPLLRFFSFEENPVQIVKILIFAFFQSFCEITIYFLQSNFLIAQFLHELLPKIFGHIKPCFPRIIHRLCVMHDTAQTN